MRLRQTTGALAALVALLMTTTPALALLPPAAPTVGSIVGTNLLADFEQPLYATGSIDQQNGWSSLGSAGHGCARYDHAVAANGADAPAAFGGQSLRISNAVTSGCFGDQTFSASVPNEAGEADATNDGMSGGVRQPVFEARWSFASAAPSETQAGLVVVASPDRGDGARMSWISMTDGEDGIGVGFYDYVTGEGEGCDGEFRYTQVASGLDRAAAHTIDVKIVFLDGAGNDLVLVKVDGLAAHVGTTWEDYFRDCQPPGSRTVDSILFRTGGPPAPATLGKGFLIDALEIATAGAA